MSNELDKHIGEQLHRYESAVDAEAIWAAVRPPRRRRPWFWLLLLLGIVSLFGGAWWMLSGEHSDELAANADSATETEITTGQDVSGSATTLERTTTEASNKNATNSPAPAAMEQEAQSDQLVPQMVESAAADLSTVPIDREEPGMMTAVTDQTTAEQTDPQESEATHSELSLGNPVSRSTRERITPESKNDEQQAVTTAVQELNETEGFTELEPEPTMDSETPASLDLLGTVDFRLNKPISLLQETPVALEQEILLEDYRRSRRRLSPWSVQLDAAYLLLNRDLQSLQDSVPNWIEQRRLTESILEAWSTDLSVSYALHQNWQIRAGLGYTQINTRFDYSTSSTTVDSVDGLQVIIFNPDNTVDSITGPIAVYETTLRERKIHNSFRQWELPLLLAYENGFGSLSFIAEAGARVRLSRSWEGQVLSQDLREVVDLKEQDWYKTQLGLSFQAGIQLGYELSPQLQLRAGGTLRYTPGKFTKEDIGFSEGYQLFGLQLGLRYQFR